MAEDPITAGLEFVRAIADKIWPDPAAKQEGLLKLETLKQNGELARLTAETDLLKGQLAINLEEAKNTNIFVSGWRPFTGWVCASAFAYKFILLPFLVFILVACGSSFDYHELPVLEWTELVPVMFALLGVGGLRTYEKGKGLTK